MLGVFSGSESTASTLVDTFQRQILGFLESGNGNSNSRYSIRVVKSRRIQQIRAISVIAVVIFHTKAEVFPNGFLGVDAFFVVSGYLIIPKILEIFSDDSFQTTRLSQFFKSRLKRLAPALLSTILGTVVLFALFGNAGLIKGVVAVSYTHLTLPTKRIV